MRLVKPTWVNHDDLPIFSIDINPDGKRFATGGQGPDCGRVVIWNIDPILNEDAETDKNVPKMLCQLDHHLACVNCVRWNKAGLLASGGDDKLIMIWRLVPGLGGLKVFGSSKAGTETWRCINTLRAHTGDILDLAWAPHKPWLASASVDNNVIIWNTQDYSVIKTLKGHTGLVKGVTWDPIGKFLASQSDDKTLRVWKTSDWFEEMVITEPFEECGGTTHILRLSWSPDGQYLVSAHAMNGGGPTAQIIERDGWKQDKDFVGHRKAVTCCRFNGNILQKKADHKDPPKKQNFCCIAIGSRDRSLSVWSTNRQRPVVVIHDLFTHSVLDISWSKCGLKLCACSKDGSICFIQFNEQELGQPLDDSETLSQLERLYGKLSLQKRSVIIEEPLIIKMKDKETQETKNSQPPPVSSLTNSVNSVKPATNCVTSPSKLPNAPTNKQIETRTSDGKRRITPMFIPLAANETAPLNSPVQNNISDGPTSSFSSSNSQSKSSIVIEKRNEIVVPKISQAAIDAKMRELPSFKEPQRSAVAAKPTVVKKADKDSTRKPVFTALKPLSSLGQMAGDYNVSISTDAGLVHLRVFQSNNNSTPLWEAYLGYSPLAAATTKHILVVATEDGSIHTFHTTKGTRIIPPLAPPAPIAKIIACDYQIMCVSCSGDVRVWDIGTNPRLVVSTSVAHLIRQDELIIHCSLYNGMPMLALSNAKAYIYHIDMGTWVLIGDSNDPVWRWSKYSSNSSMLGSVNGRPPHGPLGILQETLSRIAGMPDQMNPNWSHSGQCILTYFEHQLISSKFIGSADEYSHWLMSYVSFLASHELEKKLRVILDELLGPSHCTATLSKWDPNILGHAKHKLLEDILKMLSDDARWQRVFVEYKEQLDDIKHMKEIEHDM